MKLRVGSGLPNIQKGAIEKFPFLLPPLSKQKAIAFLLGTWDTAIEKTEALIAAKEKQLSG